LDEKPLIVERFAHHVEPAFDKQFRDVAVGKRSLRSRTTLTMPAPRDGRFVRAVRPVSLYSRTLLA
jgi:hypothetical protein